MAPRLSHHCRVWLAAGLGLQRAMRGIVFVVRSNSNELHKIGVTKDWLRGSAATGRPANHPDSHRLGEQRPADRALFAAALSRQAHAAIGLVCPRCRQLGLSAVLLKARSDHQPPPLALPASQPAGSRHRPQRRSPPGHRGQRRRPVLRPSEHRPQLQWLAKAGNDPAIRWGAPLMMLIWVMAGLLIGWLGMLGASQPW